MTDYLINSFPAVPGDGSCERCDGQQDVQEVEMEIFGKVLIVRLCRGCRGDEDNEEG
jgi:DnaJ-class molecular chaperone